MTDTTQQPPRKNRSIRLSDGGETAIQKIADRDGIQWSEAARRLLAYATGRMPEGWHPGKERR